MSPWNLKSVAAAAVFAAAAFSPVAQASLVGQTLTHTCAQCGPPYSQSFLVTDGLGPELTPFGQWSLDVEANTVTIEWLISGGIISPLDFGLEGIGITGGLASVTVDASSTFQPTLLTFTQDSININLNSLGSVSPGQFLTLNVSQSAIPEPATLALVSLSLLAASAATRRRRG